MTGLDRSEILRYLGYRDGQTADDDINAVIDRCCNELEKTARPRCVYIKESLELLSDDEVVIGGVSIKSRSLAHNLRGCAGVYVMAATLGIEVDRLINRAGAVKISDSVVYQAAATAFTEAYCDDICKAICAEEKHGFCVPRFSPGYGDFSVKHQYDILRMTDAAVKIGLTVTESCLLVPVKSVTALIGVAKEKAPKINKCEQCSNTNCDFRR